MTTAGGRLRYGASATAELEDEDALTSLPAALPLVAGSAWCLLSSASSASASHARPTKPSPSSAIRSWICLWNGSSWLRRCSPARPCLQTPLSFSSARFRRSFSASSCRFRNVASCSEMEKSTLSLSACFSRLSHPAARSSSPAAASPRLFVPSMLAPELPPPWPWPLPPSCIPPRRARLAGTPPPPSSPSAATPLVRFASAPLPRAAPPPTSIPALACAPSSAVLPRRVDRSSIS